MPKLLVVLSPSKKMAIPNELPELGYSQPVHRKQTEVLLKLVRPWTEKEIISRMGVSESIAQEVRSMHQSLDFPMKPGKSSPAILTFSGDVYRGLDARKFSQAELDFCNQSIRIISGMYGCLKPLDLIQPYRLMMATPMPALPGHASLSSFWKGHISENINQVLSEKDILINLASQEYTAAIDENAIHAKTIRCDFRELKNGKAVSVSTYAKLARGIMAKFIVAQKISSLAALKKFNLEGYNFNPSLSDDHTLMFTR